MFSMTTVVGVIAAFPPTNRPVYKYMCVCVGVRVCLAADSPGGSLNVMKFDIKLEGK